MTISRDIAMQSKAWPFQEAAKLVKRIEKQPADAAAAPVLFETGYGPSGLPHIGTFGEVARTTMVRRAFGLLSDRATELFAFSDDMDGLRKVAPNLPNQAMLAEHIDKPLTQVPDPFGTHESFGHHNNARLRAFLDQYGFDYQFVSSTDCYQSGRFDAALLRLLECYDEVIQVILPTLGPERRATYSPFLPISPQTGKVLQVPVLHRDVDAGTIVFEENGQKVELPVTGGQCKLQWKADWAMRWYALGVDYEMAGKDLIESVRLSSRICKILGGRPPDGFNYELFLDENGEKISKTKGNGLSFEEWLTYAAPETLALYMFQQPKRAKRLYFDVIPRAVDDYVAQSMQYRETNDLEKRLTNPVWHIHEGDPPAVEVPVSFGLLMNLAGAANAENKETLWGFIRRYAPDASPDSNPFLDRLVGYALNYYRDFVLPTKTYRAPTDKERAAMEDLAGRLKSQAAGESAEILQNIVYQVGKDHGFESLRDWFKALYEVLFGQSQGPRMGSFIALYGQEETIALIRQALDDDRSPGATAES